MEENFSIPAKDLSMPFNLNILTDFDKNNWL